jgi:two-component system, chemotaxis family, chemotaxis protein CheY
LSKVRDENPQTYDNCVMIARLHIFTTRGFPFANLPYYLAKGDFKLFKTILIADDSRFMRILLKNLLTDNGYQVVAEASDGSSAVSLYKEKTPDIVILDLTMSIMNGLDALKNILKWDPKAKVIIYSAMGQKRLIIDAIEIGAKDFIIKPYFNELIPALNKLYW